MSKLSARSAIRLRGVRHNNLKISDLDLPLNQMIVITGVSGSGKSSLAFDTLFAEGQRRYIETFSPYARQFFDRMDKPRVDSIEGIPPAIAIEQRNAVRTTRSTVGTMTEICDYMKVLWPRMASLYCRQCHEAVQKETPAEVWESTYSQVAAHEGGQNQALPGSTSDPKADSKEIMVSFDLPLTEKLTLEECLGLVAKQGYQRLIVGGRVVSISDLAPEIASSLASLTIVQDRIKLAPANRSRMVEACEQAYHFGKGKLMLWEISPDGWPVRPRPFSNRFHCARCDIEYREPTAALFSFNHPLGACPACKGFGRIISIDYGLVLPDRSRTLTQGVVRPWMTGLGAECQRDLLRTCRHFEIPINVPFDQLPRKWQDFVIEGEPGYGKDEEHEWPRAWYGVKGYFRWLESKAYKMHVRVLLSRYRAYTPCPACSGMRFQPETLLYRVGPAGGRSGTEGVHNAAELPPPYAHSNAAHSAGPLNAGTDHLLSLADFYQMTVRCALAFIDALGKRHQFGAIDPLGLALSEVRSRLGYLNDVGLGYLTLDRPTRSLSGGETERVNLTTCLGTRLVNTLFVLDEPSVGLHARDTGRLIRILQQLRDAGNTVVVVEHDAGVMQAADQIVDLGPGHGASGGTLVFQGTYAKLLKSSASLTGNFLSGRTTIPCPQRRPVLLPQVSSRHSESSRSNDTWALREAPKALWSPEGEQVLHSLEVLHANIHNLRDLSLRLPLNRFVCVTGVSGSGKTTLVREVLLPAVAAQLNSTSADSKASDRFDAEASEDDEEDSSLSATGSSRVKGTEHLSRVVLVDQSSLGKTPRSNPAVYIGAFDAIREFFAQSELARQRGLTASAFSFNSAQGQCERCRGAGFEKIEMQFLSDVFIRCPDCDGRRYRSHILEMKISAPQPESAKGRRPGTRSGAAENPAPTGKGWSIADFLDATVEEALAFLNSFPDSRPARDAASSMQLLCEVGLGYLRVGQPINTLSGGESQRLKLVRHLAEVITVDPEDFRQKMGINARSLARFTNAGTAERSFSKPILFLFDEPTTGLHFEDVRVLLKVFQRLVDAGHTVIVIEHNLDVIKCADWVVDLGPDAGDEGGRVVVQGTPEQVAACRESHTGNALRPLLSPRRSANHQTTEAHAGGPVRRG